MDGISAREKEHLTACEVCGDAWPIYFDREMVNGERSAAEVCREWCSLPETARHTRFRVDRVMEDRELVSMVSRRSLTGYQVFLRAIMQEIGRAETFVAKVRIAAARWNGMGRTEKDGYREQSDGIRRSREARTRSLTKRQWKRLQVLRHERRNRRRLRYPNRRCNPFMLYLHDRWSDEKRKVGGMRYRPLMYQVAREWAALHPTTKRVYHARFQASNGVPTAEHVLPHGSSRATMDAELAPDVPARAADGATMDVEAPAGAPTSTRDREPQGRMELDPDAPPGRMELARDAPARAPTSAADGAAMDVERTGEAPAQAPTRDRVAVEPPGGTWAVSTPEPTD
jgi:hypothetical protein